MLFWASFVIGGLVSGVVTGRPWAEVSWTLDRLGWTSVFSLLVAREQCGKHGKPDPFPLRYALEQLQVDGRQAVYIGDTVDDMVAARHAGAIECVPPYLDAVAHREVLLQHGVHTVLERPDQIPQVVRGWGAACRQKTVPCRRLAKRLRQPTNLFVLPR